MYQRHNSDEIGQSTPVYFASYAEAVTHLTRCGYWSSPIEFDSPKESEKFNQYYKATDWSSEGNVHYSKR